MGGSLCGVGGSDHPNGLSGMGDHINHLRHIEYLADLARDKEEGLPRHLLEKVESISPRLVEITP